MTQGDTKVTIFTTQLFFLCQMILQLLGHSAYFNTAVTKQDFMKILGVSSQK